MSLKTPRSTVDDGDNDDDGDDDLVHKWKKS